MEYLEKMKREKKVFPNYLLFFIPSWSELLGYPTLGNYSHQKVAKIISNPVIFFSGAEYAFETDSGFNYYLFGLGYYYTKFEIETGTSQLQYDKYIVDNRQLTCLCLSDFVYDFMATAKNVTLQDDEDVVINDYIFKVPIDLSNKSENQITFIKGVLMRNLFIPYKDIILEMMDVIHREDSYQIPKIGHMLLSTDKNSYNNIIASDKLKKSHGLAYFNPTAGINQITTGVDQYLSQILSTENIRFIDNVIANLKNIYSKLPYDPMYIYSILETAYMNLKSKLPVIKKTETKTGGIKAKDLILLTAEERLDSLVSWPTEFARKTKEMVEVKHAPEKFTLAPGVKLYEPSTSEASSYVPTSTLADKQKEFELRIKTSEQVQDKPLPNPPQEDIEEILLYIKKIIEENYDMKSFSIACGMARDNMRKTMLESKYVWELSKLERIYQNKPANMGLPPKEKEDIMHKINSWISNLEQERFEKERLEQERLEQERLERERVERLRLEEERRKREQIEREKLEKERQRLEEERMEAEKLAKIREQQEIARKEREKLKSEEEEKEKLRQKQLKEEQEREEKMRHRREELEQERIEQERIEKEKREFKRLKRERKIKQKQEKAKKKREKKLESLEKKKKKEKEKLNKL